MLVALTYLTYQRHYLIINHIGTICAEHNDFSVRFAASLNQVFSLIHYVWVHYISVYFRSNIYLFMKGLDMLIEDMKTGRWLNNHVFSMLKARCLLEDKQACAIRQSGAILHRIRFENTVSAFEPLPQKGAWPKSLSFRVFLINSSSHVYIFFTPLSFFSIW